MPTTGDPEGQAYNILASVRQLVAVQEAMEAMDPLVQAAVCMGALAKVDPTDVALDPLRDKWEPELGEIVRLCRQVCDRKDADDGRRDHADAR